MVRLARVVVPGLPHHVTQRGIRRTDVFLDSTDYTKYLSLLEKYCDRHALAVWAYCLMSNHVHLVVVPREEDSMARALRGTQQEYAAYMNHCIGESGHLWQGRYYSTVLDDSHLWAAIRYVETNPVRAQLSARPETYPWSSAAAHCGLRDDPVLDAAFPPADMRQDWTAFLAIAGGTAEETLRSNTRAGRVCGDEAFKEAISSRVGRDIRRRKVGRPRFRKAD